MKKKILFLILSFGALLIKSENTSRAIVEKEWAESFYRKNILMKLSQMNEEKTDTLIKQIHEGCTVLQYEEKKVLNILIDLIDKQLNHYYFHKNEPPTTKKLQYLSHILTGSFSLLWISCIYLKWQDHLSTIAQNCHLWSYRRKDDSVINVLLWSTLYAVMAVAHIALGANNFLDTFYADHYFEKCSYIKTNLMHYMNTLE